MFEQEVTTRDGVTKRVVAGSEEQLAEAVAIAANDRLAPSPDINNPAHGNVVVSQFTDELQESEVEEAEAAPVKKPRKAKKEAEETPEAAEVPAE